jgi:hypothetical protein
MTRIEQLTALRDAVRDGTLCQGDFASFDDHALIRAVFPMRRAIGPAEWVALSMEGSVDAALELFAALLPGWIWGRQVNGAMFIAKRPHTFRVQTGPGIDPARALLLAVLEALIAKEEG